MKYRKKKETFIDPVCGMAVSKNTAVSIYEYKGKTFYFCSEDCCDEFQTQPEKSLSKWPRQKRKV